MLPCPCPRPHPRTYNRGQPRRRQRPSWSPPDRNRHPQLPVRQLSPFRRPFSRNCSPWQQSQILSSFTQSCNRHHTPGTLSTCFLRIDQEADVVFSSALILVGQLNVALEATLTANNISNLDLAMRSEAACGNGRFDIVWEWRLGTVFEPIMILEYKRPHAAWPEDTWLPANIARQYRAAPCAYVAGFAPAKRETECCKTPCSAAQVRGLGLPKVPSV